MWTIKHVKNTPSNAAFKLDHKIRVKLSGDGTNIGKRLYVINITFTMLDEGGKAMSADGNHLIAVIKESENYDKLEQSLADIRKDVGSLQEISVGRLHFETEWFLGGGGGGTGNSLLVFVALVQQLYYMISMTREKNGLSLIFQKVHVLFEKLNKCQGVGQGLIKATMSRKFPFFYLFLSTMS